MFLSVANHNKVFVSKPNHAELTNMQIRGKFKKFCSELRGVILTRCLANMHFKLVHNFASMERFRNIKWLCCADRQVIISIKFRYILNVYELFLLSYNCCSKRGAINSLNTLQLLLVQELRSHLVA
jgi:hypothetical protein